MPISVFPLKKVSALREEVLSFVEKYEASCCALIEKILSSAEDVFVLLEGKKTVAGVFSYVQGGTVLSCLPLQSELVQKALEKFFKKKYCTCLSGRADFVALLRTVMLKVNNMVPHERRACALMEGLKKMTRIALPSDIKIVPCTVSLALSLMPLHTAYTLEEVLPRDWKMDRAATLVSFEKTLKTKKVYALKRGEQFVAKAQINARGKRYILLGGIFTAHEWRRKGFAQCLIQHIVNNNVGFTAVLFVRIQNKAAVHLYEKCGFKICGEYEICYFDLK